MRTHLKVSLAFVDGDDETVDLTEQFVTFRLMEEFGAGLQQFSQVILCDTSKTSYTIVQILATSIGTRFIIELQVDKAKKLKACKGQSKHVSAHSM